MTADEIVNVLRFVRYARPSLTHIAKAAGISHTLVYEAALRGRMSERTKLALERAFKTLQIGEGNIIGPWRD
jgi:hypothetical protein